ncbi:MAG: cellulase family glycosylhydrolase [Fibromonadaceae bacterium]|jgi:endoglucanase|nr:cellulase family glycosylhydrolase [Fibromonadaceae bacterium]
MNKTKLILLFSLSLMISEAMAYTPVIIDNKDIVTRYGRLVSCGNKICGEKTGGEAVQVKGPSLYWSNQDWGGHVFFKKEAIDAFVDGWNASIIRAPLSIEPGSGWGYEDKPEENWSLVETVAEAAIDRDIYVIIDWHAHNAHEDWAIGFFTDDNKAGKYCNVPNAIYEIYNEPVESGTDGWEAIKAYSNNVIKAIRDKGCNNLILVGTPFYSSEVDIAANDPPTDSENNYALVFHFYADAHKINSAPWPIRPEGMTRGDIVRDALNKGIPVFASEWGTNDAFGGASNLVEADKWHAFLDENKISWAAWSAHYIEVMSYWDHNPLTLDKIFGENLLHWTNPNYMITNGRYIYHLLTGKDTTVTGVDVDWPKFTGNTSSIATSDYGAWSEKGNHQVEDIANGGSLTVPGDNFYAGLGAWIGTGKLDKCQYGVAYSYKGAAHYFALAFALADERELEFLSGRALERADDWTRVDVSWLYFDIDEDDKSLFYKFFWKIKTFKADQISDNLQIKDVLCLDPFIIDWPEFTGNTSSIATSNYYAWSEKDNHQVEDIANGGSLTVPEANSYAGLGTWIGAGKLEICQYGVAYSYKGAAHDFFLADGEHEFLSDRSLEKTDDWTRADHSWAYFNIDEDDKLLINSFILRLSIEGANQSDLQVKDVLCLDPRLPSSSSSGGNSSSSGAVDPSSSSTVDPSSSSGGDSSSSGVVDPSSSSTVDPSSSSTVDPSSSSGSTPILLSKIATANQASQIYNGINLQATNNAVVEIYNLKGNLVNRQNFGGGVYTVSLGNLPNGMYLVKVSFGSEKRILRVPVR